MSAPDLPPPPAFEAARRERPLLVHLHSSHTTAQVLAGSVVVVIDAIRASVTIARALQSGAACVVPALSIDNARAKAQRLRERGTPRVLLGGERAGVMIEGFDLDNSPASYSPGRVEGATIVLTTSNGTAGLLLASQARRVLVGSLANLSMIVDATRNAREPVHLLCCGTRSDISLDDVLAAGAMTKALIAAGREPTSDDAPTLAMRAFEHAHTSGLEVAMASSRGGRNMVHIGLVDDVRLCATIDAVPVLPEYFPASDQIVLAH